MKSLTVLLLFFILSAVIGQTSAAPSSPPLGTPILAFDTAAQDAIYLYDLQNSNTRALRFGTGWHRMWGFSPDGCRIVFTLSDGVALSRAYTARLDGSDQRALVTFDPPLDGDWGIWEPQWSPNADDPRVSFTLTRFIPRTDGTIRREYRIGWVNPDGGNPAFYSVTGDEHTSRWSPDGSRLIYVSYEERPAGAEPLSTAIPDAPVTATVREADLWIVNADGTNKRRVTDFPVGSVSMPRWSPDGDLIAFVYSPTPNNDQVWIIGSAPGAYPTQLSYTTALALDITWLPDSSAIAAALRDFRGVAENRLWRIPLVGIADNEAVELIDPDPALTYLDYPRYSADGSTLAFRTAYALALLDFSGGVSGLLPGEFDGNTPPVWSPAGYMGEAACE